MFYFIGGTPRAGKTILSKRISKELGIPWISVDTLESVIMEYSSEEDFAQRFPKTAMRRQTNRSNDELYARYSVSDIVDAYQHQAKASWPAIRTFVECEKQYGHDYIFEGHQIHPAFLNTLKDFEFKAVFLGRGDVDATIAAASAFPGENDWFTQKTADKQIYQKISEMIVEYSSCFKRDSEKYGYTYLCVDDNFDATQEEALSYLLQ